MKISARDIQVFVAGALALLGTQALLQLPAYFFGPAPASDWYDLLFYSLSAGFELVAWFALFSVAMGGLTQMHYDLALTGVWLRCGD